jgi:hypothetical protein
MSFSPIAALGALNTARGLIRDIAALPRIFSGNRASHSNATSYASTGRTEAPRFSKAAMENAAAAAKAERADAAREARAALRRDASAFSRELGKTFRAHGIDVSQELRLRLDGNNVEVDASHPQAERINEIIARQPGLQERLQGIHQRWQSLHGADASLMLTVGGANV